ncbi:hypothetical protein BV22DRAFT_979709, partial [Leucogyrophana mollusca]
SPSPPPTNSPTAPSPSPPASPHLGDYASTAPHPNSIQPPATGVRPTGYWVITVGQEVGVFYHWNDVAQRTNNVSGAIQQKYPSFQEALQNYAISYHRDEVRAVPAPNGPFW